MKFILLIISIFIIGLENNHCASVQAKTDSTSSSALLFDESQSLILILKNNLINKTNKDQNSTILNRLNTIGLEAERLNDNIFACNLYASLGKILWRSNDKINAMDYWHKCRQLHPVISDKKYFNKVSNLNWLSKGYYKYGDYRNAIKYCKEAIHSNTVASVKQSTSDVYNTIGLCFEKLGQLDSSYHYFQTALKNNPGDKNTIWEGIVKGNIGYNLYLEKKYEQSIPLMEFCAQWAKKENDKPLLVGSLYPLADAYFELGNEDEGEKRIIQAEYLLYKLNRNELHRFEPFFIVKQKYYIRKGNLVKAKQTLDSIIHYQKLSRREFNGINLQSIHDRLIQYKKSVEVEQLESKMGKKVLTRNFTLAFLTLLLITLLYFYRQQKKKHLSEQEAKESLLIQQKKDLEIAQNALNAFAKSVAEKTQLIDQIKAELGEQESRKDGILNQLKENTILTPEAWKHFKKQFNQVYPGYLQNIQSEYPKLTQAERRYLALSKLKLSNNEMAALLGVSDQAIRVTLHRLRKKLNIQELNELKV